MRRYRTLAQVFTRTDVETAFGGRSVNWTPLVALWVQLPSPQRREDGSGEAKPIVTEKILAESRTDPRVEAGQRVDVEGIAWRLVHVDLDAPRMGCMTLTLTREL